MRILILSAILIVLCVYLAPVDANAQNYKGKFVKELCKCSSKIDIKQEKEQIQEDFDKCSSGLTMYYKEELEYYFEKQKEYKNFDDFINHVYQLGVNQCIGLRNVVILISESAE